MTKQNSSWSQRLWQGVTDFFFPAGGQISRRLNGSSHYHNEFVIIGLGRFGTSLAMTLNAYRHDVLAIDSDPKRVQQVSQVLPHVIQLDATNIEALREVGVDAFDTGVVCIGTDLESNLLATVSLRKLGVRRVITKARTVTQQDILLKVGADEVILPEHEAGVRLARKLAAVDFVDFMELTEDTGVVEIIAPSQLTGQSLRETQIRQRYGLTIVAIRRGNNVIISPGANEMIQEDDILVVLGRTIDCERLR
ncbi:MAG: TrkA family potassium uptake protein [Anaerolineae bacterium]|nr:TrkA family potassium uptake protein [Anaerolineae bacterium]